MDNSIFYTKAEANGFDNLQVDLASLYAKYPLEKMLTQVGSSSALDHQRKFYARSWMPLKFRLRSWQTAFRSQRDITWFEEFNSYWTGVLGGRPLWSPQDVYFLKNVYRIKFQQNTLPDTEDPIIHLQAWQRPEVIYSLLHLLTKETFISDVRIIQKGLKLASKARGASILEFGCGLAPLTYAALKFMGGSQRNQFFLADLASLPYHYAAWRMRGQPNVKPSLLSPKDGFALNLQNPMDVIFCIQVFEHLNKPLETVRLFHKLLNKNGVLVFDFLLGKGEGLDSIQAVRERNQVVGFINSNFDLLGQPRLDPAKSVDLTFARKG
jgi:SAM-dependent methyltransferase